MGNCVALLQRRPASEASANFASCSQGGQVVPSAPEEEGDTPRTIIHDAQPTPFPGMRPLAQPPDDRARSSVACRLRIIAINDVYELDNLSRLKTLVEAKTNGWPRENVLVTLAGDFLAPSLLSSLDAGHGMVKVLNAIPVDLVCFGNHESDIPYSKLLKRIDEFEGTWLNSNMPAFKPELPRYLVRQLRGSPGSCGGEGELGVRTVAFMGLCIGGGRHRSVYRKGVFGDAAESMVPVNEAALALEKELRRLHPEIDEIIPLTHQDLPDDVELAKTGLFPAIVAGHDHEVINQREGPRGCPVVKAGQDATHAAVIDFSWPQEPGAPPEVEVRHEAVTDWEPEQTLAERIEKIKRPVYELETAVVYEIGPDEVLTSEHVRSGEVTMARLVATALREVLHCDAAIINSGAIRGNKTYSGCVSYGDLKRECPFPSPIVALPLPFSVLQKAVYESRRPWFEVPPGEPPKEAASSLQVDDGMEIDDHRPVTIGHKPPVEDAEHLYVVACDTRVMRRNDVLREYCDRHAERVPPDDAGRPVLPLLAEFFCGQLWRRLIDSTNGLEQAQTLRTASISSAFSMIDADNNGVVDAAELTEAVENRLGHRLSSRIVVEQMLSMMDQDSNGLITEQELRSGVAKMICGHEPVIVSL